MWFLDCDRWAATTPDGSSAALQEMKTFLGERLALLELPPNPLDDIIDRLGGPDKVAELSGRTGRMLAEVGEDGKTRYRYTKRAGQKKGKRDEDGPKEEKVRGPASTHLPREVVG